MMTITPLLRGPVSVAAYACTAEASARPYAEQHTHWSVSYVKAGSFGCHCRGRRFDLMPGAVLLGRPGDEFTCTHDHHGGGDECLAFFIEPEVADDATRSFRTGTLQTVHNPPTIADGVRTPYLGQYTFPLVLHYVDDMQTVSEEAIKEAVRFFFYRMKLVVEPSGALGLAALLSGAVPVQGQRVGVVISGGNIDGAMMAEILRSRIED